MSPERKPSIVEEVETETKSQLASPWNVIVHDDPITLMVYVTRVFRMVFGYSETKVHQLMMEVHKEGQSVVWTGSRERAEFYVHKLHAHQLLASLDRIDVLRVGRRRLQAAVSLVSS